MSLHRSHANLHRRFRRQIDQNFRPVPGNELMEDLEQRNNRSSALTPDLRERQGYRHGKSTDSRNPGSRTAEAPTRHGPTVEVLDLFSDESDRDSANDADHCKGRLRSRRRREHGRHHVDRNGKPQGEMTGDSENDEDEKDDEHSDHEKHTQEKQDATSTRDEAADAISSIEGISNRSWEISCISDAQDVNGLEKYEVCWAPSRHPARQIELGVMQDGQRAVWAENEMWPIFDISQATPDDSAKEQTVVDWSPTWHPIWDLRSALRMVAKYHSIFPPRRLPGPRITVTDISQLMPVRRTFHDPEPDGILGTIHDLTWLPEEGVDYTKGLLRLLELDLKAGRNPFITHTVISYMNTPARQQLKFRPEFVAAGAPFNAQRPLAATAYIVGNAHEDPCDHCKSGPVSPFPKCVTLPGFCLGACVNCSLTRDAASCKYREENRIKALGIPESLLLADEDTDEEGEALSGEEEQHQVGDREEAGHPQEVEWYTAEEIPLRPKPSACAGDGGNVVTSAEDDEEIPYEELVAALDEVTGPSPDAVHSPSSDACSSSPPSQDRGILESSQEVNVEPDASYSSPQTSPSSIKEPIGPPQGSPPDISPAKDEFACRKRRRDSEPSIGPSQRRCRSSNLLDFDDVLERGMTDQAHHRRSPSRESSSSLEILPDPIVDADAPLIDRVIVRDTFSHPECGHWQNRCKHPIIGSADPEAPPTSIVHCFVPINKIKTEDSNGKQIVFNDQQFEAGDLNEGQVQFILSRCKCRTTQLLHDAWEDAIIEDPTFDTKWAYLSLERSDEMNAVIAKFCPERNGTRENPIEV